jgi:hypothetical protein
VELASAHRATVSIAIGGTRRPNVSSPGEGPALVRYAQGRSSFQVAGISPSGRSPRGSPLRTTGTSSSGDGCVSPDARARSQRGGWPGRARGPRAALVIAGHLPLAPSPVSVDAGSGGQNRAKSRPRRPAFLFDGTKAHKEPRGRRRGGGAADPSAAMCRVGGLRRQERRPMRTSRTPSHHHRPRPHCLPAEICPCKCPAGSQNSLSRPKVHPAGRIREAHRSARTARRRPHRLFLARHEVDYPVCRKCR